LNVDAEESASGEDFVVDDDEASSESTDSEVGLTVEGEEYVFVIPLCARISHGQITGSQCPTVQNQPEKQPNSLQGQRESCAEKEAKDSCTERTFSFAVSFGVLQP
jgi:hypothetical protein